MSCVYAVIGTHSLVSLKVAQRRIQCSRHNSHGGCAYLQCIQSQHVCGPSWELLGLVYLPRLPKVSTANPICSFSVKVFTPAISSCCQNGHRKKSFFNNLHHLKLQLLQDGSECTCVRVLPSFLTFIATILVIVKDLGHCQRSWSLSKILAIVKAPRPGRNFSRIISGSQWRRATDPGWHTKGNIVKAVASTIVLNALS